MELIKIEKSEFDAIYAHLEKNFIQDERRDFADAKALLENPDFAVYHTVEGENKIGFITLWSFENFDFIEHFVTYEAYRNQGYGTKVIELLRNSGKALVLEAELPKDDIQKRRISFYERNGFVQNSAPYVQPPYRSGEDGVSMVLMSYPCALMDYDGAVKRIYKKVYNVNYEKNTHNAQYL